ncbi:Arylsulfatase A [Neorhodopirellula lusitana]|uniref:Arylsulfatase A n=1 Tax=Neorhodopirellula lusitana TaxID=445327 RepID=A0ABY1PSP8_9BACT|nr:sulfatase-like hydrolase/transferase [Neorhodopirellula lusitana]SMP43777.1 Arylsulfatase A [Neorhodopirellula lusitana]
MRFVAIVIVGLAFAAGNTSRGVSSESTKPNVVLILIDDLSHYGVTAYGANRLSSESAGFENVEFSTPNIDRLAREGVRCDYAFAYPLCEPTRTTLMSGKYGNRNHLVSKGQHASDITFGDVFKRDGYSTCMAGKWKQSRGTNEIPAERYISEFGWDEYCCFDVVAEGRRYINPDLVVNDKRVAYSEKQGIDPETGRRWYGPDLFNRFALDFIERKQSHPFFLYYPMVLVHDEHKPTPDTEPRSLFDHFDDANNNKNGHTGDDKKYFPDMVEYTDNMIGRVVDKINSLGLRQNTLIVVMGDNGTKEPFAHVLPDGTSYQGDKGSTTDNGTHVPLIMSQPGTIPVTSGDHYRTYEGLVDLADIYPTLCDAAGIEPVNARDIDGVSCWPQMKGAPGVHRQSSYVWYNHNRPMTDQTEVLEYAFDKQFKRYAPDRYYPEGRFFDLRTDLQETGGDRQVKGPGWQKYYHSGLDLVQLTTEQKQAYDRLGKVLDEHRYVAVKQLQIVPLEQCLTVGQTVTLDIKVTPQDATRNNVIWESSNPGIASVNKFGEISSHRQGEVTISAYSWEDANPVANNARLTMSREGIMDSIMVDVQ